jgi:hypothetical protein
MDLFPRKERKEQYNTLLGPIPEVVAVRIASQLTRYQGLGFRV